MTTARYVGRVANGATLEEVKDYIKGQGVDVVELEQLATKHALFQSYKLVIKRADVNKVMEDIFWPEGVTCRPFFKPRQLNEDNPSGQDV